MFQGRSSASSRPRMIPHKEEEDDDGRPFQRHSSQHHPPAQEEPPPPAAPATTIALQRRTPSLNQYQTTSITKHYALNNKLLAAFESHYQSKNFVVAYAIGLQFVETALLEIPKHGYWESPKHAEERVRSSEDALRVTQLLEKILLNHHDGNVSPDERQKVETLHHLALEQQKYNQESSGCYEEERSQVEQTFLDRDSSILSVSSSLLSSCGDSFAAILCPEPMPSAVYDSVEAWDGNLVAGVPIETAINQSSHQEEEENHYQPLQKSRRSSSIRSSLTSHPEGEGEGLGLAPPPAHVRTQSEMDLQRALFLSGLQVQPQYQPSSSYFQNNLDSITEQQQHPSSTVQPPPGRHVKRKSSVLPVDLLISCYQDDFVSLVKNSGRIQLSHIPTYQGRVPGSINGCTVIAPLLCIHHFTHDHTSTSTSASTTSGSSIIPDQGLSNDEIQHVLDEEVPSLLPALREQLGVAPQAFLIPSDAHDALLGQNYLGSDQFVTVIGGNMLQEDHLQPLLDMLSTAAAASNGNKKKMAVTLFYKEHVITILQLRQSASTCWYDVIDSLPHPETLLDLVVDDKNAAALPLNAHADSMMTMVPSWGEPARGNLIDDETDNDLQRTLEASRKEHEEQQLHVQHEPEPTNAVRIRCLDIDALQATLRWYACSVLSDDHKSYIDQYEWEEKNADFDPRVFQAFVWTQA